MRFILTPVGSSGDVHPFIGLGRALQARGHEVIVVTAGPFAGVVERAGLHFHQTVSAEEFDRIARQPDLWHPRRGLRIVLETIASRLRDGYACLEAHYEPGRTILIGHSLSFFTRVFEEVHNAPSATIHLAPSILRSDYEQPAYAPGRDASTWPRWIKRSLWWAIDRVMIDPCIVPALNQWRQTLRLPPVNRVFREWIHSPRRVIGLFPDWFAAPQPDWPAALRLTGFALYDESDQVGVPDRLLRFLDDGPPPIVITPGTANQAATAFFQAAVDACDRIGRRSLLLTRYASQLPALPSTARHEPFVPLSQLLPRCAALVHHGGIGTAAQGLAAGVPQLTMPMGFDQPDNATRLQRLGVGRWIVPSAFTASRVASTLSGLLDDPRTADRCRQWSDALRAHDALERTCDLLEQTA